MQLSILPVTLLLVIAVGVAAVYGSSSSSRYESQLIESLLHPARGVQQQQQQRSLSDGETLMEVLRRMQRRRRGHCWKYSLRSQPNHRIRACAIRFLSFANSRLRKWHHRSALASYRYNTDINDRNAKRMTQMDIRTQKFENKLTLIALKFKPLTKRMRLSARQLRMLTFIQHGLVYKSVADMRNSAALQTRMRQIYNKASGCYATGKCLPTGEGNVKKFFQSSKDFDQLRHLWLSWRNATGPKLKPLLLRRIPMLNAAAKASGNSDYSQFEYVTDFEDKNLEASVLSLYNEMRPLYQQLHAYLRHRLSQKYKGKMSASGLLPAHLGHDPWGSEFQNWANEFAPNPGAGVVDFDSLLQQRQRSHGLRVEQLPHIADSFFRSLGLPAMTRQFWRHSVFQQPPPTVRRMNCHGSAYDMFDLDRNDYRIKMCSRLDMTSFSTVHHEMGHIMYFMMYSRQPTVFRQGANSGFHEAVGDTITLAVKTAQHFKRIGFAKNVSLSFATLQNSLLLEALENVMFIPYAMTVDLWRWRMYNGSISSNSMNREWWRLTAKYRGIGPPADRSESDADALAKYHTALNIPYIRYFFSFILKFQFYEALCKEAGHRGELATCDFYQSRRAGDKLGHFLSLGSSKPWPEALQQLTGSRSVSAQPMLRYFKPLHDWLVRYNRRHGVKVGWDVPADPLRAAV